MFQKSWKTVASVLNYDLCWSQCFKLYSGVIPVELVTREKFGKMMVDTKSDRQATIALGTYQQIKLLKFEDNKKKYVLLIWDKNFHENQRFS